MNYVVAFFLFYHGKLQGARLVCSNSDTAGLSPSTPSASPLDPDKNVTLLGDGSKKSVITGKKSFADAITTFKTATFSKDADAVHHHIGV